MMSPPPDWLTQNALQMRRNLTLPERTLWERIRRKSLGAKFRRKVIMFGRVVDFWCPEKNLVVEIDGESHSVISPEESMQFNEEGISVLLISSEDALNNADQVLELIASHAMRGCRCESCRPSFVTLST